MSFDLTNKNIQDTFQNLLQKTGSEGKLFDLVGNEITDLTIGGTLTAHSYITSESIVNTSSGSTAFGNSSDDTHKFIGNITASGNISASGDIIATGTGSFSDGRFSGFVGIGNGGSAIAPEALLHLQNTEDDKYLQRWTLNNIEGGIFGDASGDVLKIQVNSNDALAFTTNATERVRIAKDGGTSFTSHITASGNISGSSTSTLTLGGDITTNNTIILPGDGGATHETIINAHNQRGMLKKQLNAVYWQVGQGTNQFEITDGANGNSTKGNVLLRADGRDDNDNKLFLVPDGAQLNIGGNITASGNISASGDVFAFTGSFNYITASELDLDGQTLRIGGESFTKANIQTLKQGRTLKPLRLGKSRPDIEAEDGLFDGDITASGDILNTRTIQMRNSSSVIDTFNTGSHQTCKYILQVTSGSHIQSSEMLVVQSGSNAFNTEYAQIGTNVNLGSFSTSVSGNVVKLNFAGDFISCSIKLNRKLI